MATISSTLRLIEQTTAPIQHTIDAMNRMVDAMETVNRTADIPNMEQTFGEIRGDINLATHALDQFNDELQNTDRHTNTLNRMSDSFHGFSRAVIVANQGLQLVQQTWSGINKLGSKSDDRIGADARLNLINDGLRTQEQLELQVMAAANATRTEYESTAELVARMGRQDYFKGSNDTALAFATTLNQGLVVSGASAAESASVLTQLSQGIASGVLRGEEFNSIMENGSVIAEMMTQSLGITKGELRAMAQDGQLTTDVVVSSIMAQAAAMEEQFNRMPVTYGQATALMHNQASQLMDTLSQPGQAIDVIITKIEALNAWLDTAEGQIFFTNMAQGISFAVNGIAALAVAVGDTVQFFSNNWTTIEPILWGIGTAVGGLTLAYLIYKGVLLAVATADAIKGAAQMIATGSTMAQTAAQWGLNTALLACPITWIVIGIVAIIAIIVALTMWIIDLWKTNIDFKVGVIGVWNDILGFFDQVPIFFMGVGYGIADAFSYAKTMSMIIMEQMINQSIERINWLINKVNSIPGVSINAIEGVSFGAETAIEEQVQRAERAASLADANMSAAQKATERERQLGEDEATWRAQAEAQKQSVQDEQKNVPFTGSDYDFPPMTLAGGKIDKIGGEVDISDQSIAYLSDIAEIQALGAFDAYNTVAYEQADDLRLDPKDADLMRTSASNNTNIYYLNYNGGVRVKNDVKQGQDWESIAQEMREQSQNEIETGISMVEEVVYSR